MNWKKASALILLAALPIALAGVIHAQTESDIATTRAALQADRQATVAANLTLTEAQAAAFWPLYREYRAEMALVGDQLQKMITTYAMAYNSASVTDEQGMAITKDYLKLKKDGTDIRSKYLSKFGKVIPGKSVMRFYQIENKLDVIVDAALASEIPLVQ